MSLAEPGVGSGLLVVIGPVAAGNNPGDIFAWQNSFSCPVILRNAIGFPSAVASSGTFAMKIGVATDRDTIIASYLAVADLSTTPMGFGNGQTPAAIGPGYPSDKAFIIEPGQWFVCSTSASSAAGIAGNIALEILVPAPE